MSSEKLKMYLLIWVFIYISTTLTPHHTTRHLDFNFPHQDPSPSASTWGIHHISTARVLEMPMPMLMLMPNVKATTPQNTAGLNLKHKKPAAPHIPPQQNPRRDEAGIEPFRDFDLSSTSASAWQPRRGKVSGSPRLGRNKILHALPYPAHARRAGFKPLLVKQACDRLLVPNTLLRAATETL